MKQVILVFLIASSRGFAADASGWRHEWSHIEGDRVSSLSVRKCEGLACDVKFVGAGCMFSGVLRVSEATADTTAVVTATDYAGKDAACTIELKRVKADSSDLAVTMSGEKCGDFCVTKLPYPTALSLHSERPYLAKISTPCYEDKSPAMQSWCTSQDVQDLVKTHADLSRKIDALLLKDTYVEKSPWFDSLMATCNLTPQDATNCIRKHYDEAIASLQKELTAAQDSRDKRYKALKTRGDKVSAKAILGNIAGVYKRSFKNGSVDGSKYQSEDILEIVRVSDDTLYFKTALDFFNGHTCGLFGMATFNAAGQFVFVEPAAPHCILRINVTAKDIELEDDPEVACRESYCGARGMFSGTKFALQQKRPIRYMKRLLESKDYKNTVEEFNKNPPF